MATKKSQTPTTQNKPQPSKAPPPPLPPKSNPKLPKSPAVKPPASGEKSAGKILPLPTSGSKSDKDKLGQAGKETNTTTTSSSGQNAGGNFERGSAALFQGLDTGADASQKRSRTAARRLPTTTERQDYEYALDRMSYESPMVRRFVKRLNSQRNLVDGFLNSSPSLELILNKMFMEFGRDEEEDKLLMKAVRLHIKGRGGNTAEQDTPEPEPEPEMPTPEEIQMVRDFPALYEAWNADPAAFERDFNNLVEQRQELRRLLRWAYGAEREQLLDAIRQLDTEIERRSTFLEGVENLGATEYYATLIEEVFAYEVNFGDEFQENSPEGVHALTNLSNASFDVINYLNDLGLDGVVVFREYFAQTSGEGYNPITITVGASTTTDEVENAYVGNTPLYSDRDQMYLGSLIGRTAIGHEFFHQLDRYFSDTGVALSPATGSLSFNQYLLNNLDLLMDPVYIQDRAHPPLEEPCGGDNEPPCDMAEEIFADFGMTAVFDGSGLYAQVDDTGPYIGFSGTTNSLLVQCAFGQYLYQILTTGQITAAFNEDECQNL